MSVVQLVIGGVLMVLVVYASLKLQSITDEGRR